MYVYYKVEVNGVDQYCHVMIGDITKDDFFTANSSYTEITQTVYDDYIASLES